MSITVPLEGELKEEHQNQQRQKNGFLILIKSYMQY